MRSLKRQGGFWESLIAPAIGGIASFFGGERRNEAQEAQSAAQMAFQERMSSTAHQREIADLKAAGLNPMLSARLGGASSPAGSQAQLEDTLTPAVNSAMAAATTKANLDLIKAQTLKATNEAEQSATQAGLNRANIPLAMQNIAEVDARTRLHGASASELANREMLQTAQKILADNQGERYRVMNDLDRQRAKNLITEQEYQALQLFFRSMDWGKVSSEANAWKTWWGQNVMPYSQSGHLMGSTADHLGRALRGLRMPWR